MVIINLKRSLLKGFISFLILFSLQAKAQTENDFEQFNRDLYTLIADTAEIPKLEYIRIKTYNQLIDEQDWPDSKKEEVKLRVQKSYPYEYEEFHKRLGLIVDYYQEGIKNGGRLEYLSYSYEEHPYWKNRYIVNLRLLFSSEEMISTVNFEYHLYYSGKALLFIGDQISESY